MKHQVGLFAGSFDPPTLGHVDLIRRAANLCELLYVGIATNRSKKLSFTPEERQAMLAEVCHDIPHVKVVLIPGLVAEYAKLNHIDFLIRGLRSNSDLEFEMQMACANRKLENLETIFLLADPQHAHISSSLIHEIAHGGYRLHGFVPTPIEDAVYTRITLKL